MARPAFSLPPKYTVSKTKANNEFMGKKQPTTTKAVVSFFVKFTVADIVKHLPNKNGKIEIIINAPVGNIKYPTSKP